MTNPPIPNAFLPVQTQGFGGFAGPVLAGEDDKGLLFLFDIAKQHLNGDGRLHGGMMMSLMAIVMGETANRTAAAREAGAKAKALSLNCDFVSAGLPGDRVEGRATVTRATRSVLFMSATLNVGEKALMTATGVYAIKAGGQ
jgi:uncharacterized protein (TIGR00369 family)